MPKADFSQLSNEKIIAQPGRYHVRIVKAGPPKNPDSTGVEVVQISYEIISGEDRTAIGAKITDFVPFTGPRAWKFKNLASSLNASRTGDEPEFIEGQEWEYGALLDRELEIDIEYGQRKTPEGTYVPDPSRRNVKNYMPYVRASEIPDDFMSFANKVGQ